MFNVAKCKLTTHEEDVAIAVMITGDINHIHPVTNCQQHSSNQAMV